MLHHEHARISSPTLDTYLHSLTPEMVRIQEGRRDAQYSSAYSFLHALHDKAMITRVKQLATEKKQLNPRALVIIGIGGSNLGAKAVYEAMHGLLPSDQACQLYYADTCDAKYLAQIIARVTSILSDNHAILLAIISKSGTTTETIANAQIFIALLQRYHPDTYAQYVIAITDTGSALHQLATQERYAVLEIPREIGGRFSLFSPVGLLPLALMDVDIDALLAGGRVAADNAQNLTRENMAAVSAITLFYHYQQGCRVHDTFLFGVALESLGKWYRQLLGESIGKEYTKNGQDADSAYVPTVSIGSTDLHSVGQLYLANRSLFMTSFVTVTQQEDIQIPALDAYKKLLPWMRTISCVTIIDAIIQGTQGAYVQKNKPFLTWHLPNNTAYYIGQWMCIKMIETVYLAHLFNINCFDQPNVEEYKKITRKLLAHE